MKKILLLTLLCIVPSSLISKSDKEKAAVLIERSRDIAYTNPGLGVDYAMQAYDLVKGTKDSVNIVSSLLRGGYAYELQSDFDMSLECYYKALICCPETKHLHKAQIMIYIGALYGQLNDYPKAIEFIDKATSICKAYNDSAGIAVAYNARGLIHSYIGENNIADKFFTDALVINKAMKNEKNIAGNINNLCLSKGDSEHKIEMLLDVIELNEKNNQNWSLAENYNNLGLQYYFLGKFKEGHKALNKAYKYAETVNSDELICDNYEYRIKILAAQKDYKGAYEYGLKLKEKSTLLDKKLANIERRITTQRMKEKEKENLIQKQKNQINLLRLNIAIGLLITCCVTVVIIFFMRRYRRKKNLEIMESKVAILSQEKIIADLKLKQKEKELETQSQHLKSTQYELTNFALFVESRDKLLEKIRQMVKDSFTMSTEDTLKQLKSINAFILQFKRNEKEENSNLIKEVEDQNKDFIERLTQKHPEITSGGKMLAVFLRINLSTKEISTLTGVSVKAIEMSRYRLRKSLDLDSKCNICEYLRTI